jgi:hypothetical protein
MLHNQRKELGAHISNEMIRIYKSLCSFGLGPTALIDANVLKWGHRGERPPTMAQILPYDYGVERRRWGSNEPYKETFFDRMAHNLFACRNVKYSKQLKVIHKYADKHSIYANIPIIMLDGGNNVDLSSLSLLPLFEANAEKPLSPYNVADGKDFIEKLIISPSFDCPDIQVPANYVNLPESFYPERIRI